MARVVVLGAGFSKAAAQLPLMTDMLEILGNLREIPRSAHDAGERSGLGFEGVLAFLANEQPFLSNAENLRNRAAFEGLTQRLARTLFDIERDSARETWLDDLVRKWHDERADVISLNYDLLVERAAASCHASWSTSPGAACQPLWPIAIPTIASRYHGVLGDGAPESLRLAKLHGSIGWAYSGSEAGVGAQIYDLGLPPHKTWTAYFKQARDLVPVIVPPALAKSPWLSNVTLRAIWREAGYALKRAREVTVIGYSMREADLQARALLATANPSAVVCIDPNQSVLDTCKTTWPKCEHVRHFRSVAAAVEADAL